MQQPKKIAIVGSSHVSWWEHAIKTGQIPKPYHDITFIGLGAMPIWGDFIRTGIAEIEDQVDEIFLLLGDFRHGNRILLDEKFLQTGDTSGKFLNIAKELISDENDKILLGLIIKSLGDLRSRLGSKLRILFWSLTYREFQSLEQGRYGGRGNYRHPVWNLADLVETFSDVAIDTLPLMPLPIHSFFLDASGHPTFKGHAFLSHVLNGQTALEAYGSVCDDFESWGHLLFPPDAGQYRVKITGDSIAFDALAKAVRTGYFSMPPSWEVVDLKTSQATKGDYDRIAYFSGLHFEDEGPEHIKAKIAEEKAAIQKLNLGDQAYVIFWDQWAREIISKRPEYRNKFLPKSAEGYVESIEQAAAPFQVKPLSPLVFDKANGMVEFGGSFTPSGKGFAVLFHLILSDDLITTAFSRYEAMANYCLNQTHSLAEPHDASPDTGLAPLRTGQLQGNFDGVSLSGRLCGWALNPNDLDHKVPVYLFSGKQLIASATANQLWADFQFGDGGDGGFYGFSSGALPLSLLRNLRVGSELRASFDPEGQVELPGSPLKLGQESLSKLALAAIIARKNEFNAPRHQRGDDYRIPADGRSLFIAKKLPPESDPAIFPQTETVLDNAVVENIKRLPPFFKAVMRARVIGGVYHQDGKLEASALSSSAFGVYQLADPTLTTKPTRHIDTECLYGGMLTEHYGHFIIESLARFQAFQRFPTLPIVFTLPNPQISKADGLPAYMRSIFELLGIPLGRIILVQETTSFKKLVVPKIGMRWFDYLSVDHYLEMALQVKQSLGENYPLKQNGSIYLSRSRLSTNHEGNIICGEAEFENYLKAEGVTVVYPETLTVKEQIQLFCGARNAIGFVGSGLHTLLLCPDVPEKVFYLNRRKAEVNPQYPLIDKVLDIDGHYFDGVIKSNARVSLVDFEAISQTLMASGVVKRPFDPKQHDFEKEFALLTEWLHLKRKSKNLTLPDEQRLETIIGQCLSHVAVKEAQALLQDRQKPLEQPLRYAHA
ncbi:MAG: glycosyltransferase 61 family protein [Methylovulum miyakonense]|uniref:glycosyltransferase family 61 protein n=1 Tax=Methylovulum miyakonense TaxID=645578 RepID=UPI003BB49B60